MTNQMIRTVAGLSLLIIGMLAIVSCVPGDYTNVEASTIGADAASSLTRANTASIARWEGIGQQYAALSRVDRTAAGIADTARWEAKGAFYSAVASNRIERGQAADIARWQAKGALLEALNSKAVSQPNIDALRWMALGASYKQSVAVESNADAARWTALGERYQHKFEIDDGLSADVARWVRLGESYQ